MIIAYPPNLNLSKASALVAFQHNKEKFREMTQSRTQNVKLASGLRGLSTSEYLALDVVLVIFPRPQAKKDQITTLNRKYAVHILYMAEGKWLVIIMTGLLE